MPDIAPVKGLIELTDNFTSELGLAEAALSNFTKSNQESLKAVAGAAGLITAAIGGITVAAIELGKRGADVNDVNQTLEHFAGSAKQAEEDMNALRNGVKGTVDNFALAKDAAQLLSAGVKLTTSDFSTLGQAAFVLQNRGLGPTKDQLDLVSEALVTGRTRALAMKLGVIDAGDAQEQYAKSLGVSVDKLSDAGKAEANRIAVMKILRQATADAGEQERDFGEEFEAAGAKIQNWIDDLGGAIASSKVFAAGFKAIESALSSAFGGDNQQSIQKVVKFLEDGAIQLVNFAQVAITGARVVEGAFNGIKTVILGVITAASGIADGLVEVLTVVAQAAAKISHPFQDADNDPLVVYLKTTRTELRGMTADLATQTKEAALATVGHTAFDKTLDGLSDTITGISKAMSDATTSTTANTTANGAADANAKKLADTNKQLTQSMVDQKKISDELQKSTTELTAIWSKYFAQVAADSGTTLDKERADIKAWFDESVKSLDKMDPLYKEKYAAFEAIAKEKLDAINADWDSVRDNSIEGLQQQADKALETYEKMLTSGLHFNREVLDAQLQKYHELQDRVRTFGTEAKNATDSVKDRVTILDSAWDAVGQAVDDNRVKVRLLDGEVVSVAEALKRLNDGGSFSVTSANFASAVAFYTAHQTPNFDPMTLARAGYSFAEIVQYAFGARPSGPLPPPSGPRIPGFKDGGTVMVGENGPEVVRLPLGATVYPTGTPSNVWNNNGSNTLMLNFQVNGTAEQSAKKIKDIILNELRLRKQF